MSHNEEHNHAPDECPGCKAVEEQMLQYIGSVVHRLRGYFRQPPAGVTILVRIDEDQSAVFGDDTELAKAAEAIQRFAKQNPQKGTVTRTIVHPAPKGRQ